MSSTQKVYTFTVCTHDKANMELVESIKEQCRSTGVTFTWTCLQALKQYAEAKGDHNVKRRN